MTTEELAYAAGIIDGEGCITILCRLPNRKNPKHARSYQPAVIVAMNDPEPIDFLEHYFPASQTSTKRGYKIHHRWSIWSLKAIFFLQNILPYLKVKKMQAQLVIEFQQYKDKQKVFRRS